MIYKDRPDKDKYVSVKPRYLKKHNTCDIEGNRTKNIGEIASELNKLTNSVTNSGSNNLILPALKGAISNLLSANNTGFTE